MCFISLHRFWSLDLQVSAQHLSSGRCLATPTALPLSAVQGATGHPAVHMQGLWALQAYVPSVLPLLQPPPSACQSRDPPVLCYFPCRYQRPPAWNIPQIPVWGESASHQHRPVRPTKSAPWLHKDIQAIHIQSNPTSCKLAFTYELLALAHPLHKFPAQCILWAALTMANFGFLQMGKFMVDQEIFDPTRHFCVQDVTLA